ncbi:MAG TPA: hypothetical protein VKH42_20740 [Vicinamibacterales bacterium]|nr:hypothetical protein [Vicinamibacterales bacterium]
MYRHSLVFVCLSFCAAPLLAQDAPQPRFELETLTLYARYRLVENNAEVVTASQLQIKDSLRARVNVDEGGRFSIHVGAFTGSSFTSSWDTTGAGTGDWSPDAYLKQLYLSAAPARGIEAQVGGLYFSRGESTEITTYDEDGFLMGERIAIRKPTRLFFDEVSATRAGIGSPTTPGVLRRFDRFAHPDYWQVQAVKRFGTTSSAAGAPVSRWSASADVTSAFGARTIRAAVAARLPQGSPITGVRFEQYRRIDANPAGGFAVSVDRPVTSRLKLQAGYATIDEFYGGLNADRIQRGPRVFAIATVSLPAGLSVQIFGTRAFETSYAVSNRTRFDAVVSYDVLTAARRRTN